MATATTRSRTANPAALEPTERKAATGVGAPSYTSGVHWWNGTMEILKPNPASLRARETGREGGGVANLGGTPPEDKAAPARHEHETRAGEDQQRVELALEPLGAPLPVPRGAEEVHGGQDHQRCGEDGQELEEDAEPVHGT